jgi:hypothetical protein
MYVEANEMHKIENMALVKENFILTICVFGAQCHRHGRYALSQK